MAGYLRNLWNALWGRSGVVEEQYLPLEGSQRLDALRWYYENNATYDRIATALRSVPGARTVKGIRSLENPAHKVVEFYAAKLFPRDLMDLYEGPQNLKIPLEEIDKWSNWGQRQRVAARWDAMYGNLYLKVASSEDQTRVYRQLIDPRFVTYFETDDRDFFTYLRIDTPQERRNDEDEIEPFHVTEVYDKEAGTYKRWEHEEGPDATLEEVRGKGKLVANQILSEKPPLMREDGQRFTGFDFIPVVHIKFRDIGNALGAAAFAHVLEAIDQLNFDLTKLDEMLFPEVHLSLENAATAGERGGPIDPPRVDASDLGVEADEAGIRTVKTNKTRLWRMPAGWGLKSTVPPIDFASHLAAIDAMLLRLEKMLPELAYYRLRDMQEISGRAARILLGDVIDRVEEARDNLLAGLVRSNQMALTIGRALRLEGFENLGDFKSGALDHSFEEEDVFPISELEEAEAEKAKAEADEAKARVYGLPQSFLRNEAGFADVSLAGAEDVVAADPDVPAGDDLADTERIFKQLFPGGGA